MFRYVFTKCALACLVFAGTTAIFAQTTPVAIPTVQTTGMVGLADSQTAQLNLLNLSSNPVLTPTAVGFCTANVSFIDGAGTVLKTGTVAVAPGRSVPFALPSTDPKLSLMAGGERREIRATISMPAIPPPPTPAGTAAPIVAPVCHLVPTLEIFDSISGRTLVVLEQVVTVPSVLAILPPVATP